MLCSIDRLVSGSQFRFKQLETSPGKAIKAFMSKRATGLCRRNEIKARLDFLVAGSVLTAGSSRLARKKTGGMARESAHSPMPLHFVRLYVWVWRAYMKQPERWRTNGA